MGAVPKKTREGGKSLKKALIIGLICLLGLISRIGIEVSHFYDAKLHVVFCNVGQGDAIFVRTPQGKNLLFDGGPDDSVLDCLSRHMPFWEHTIDLMMLSHPHNDHYSGLITVLERYTTKSFTTEKLVNTTLGFQQLMQEVGQQKIPVRYVYGGDSFQFSDGVSLQILGPSRGFLQLTSPHGKILETKEFASIVQEISFGTLDVLLTGDSQISGLKDAVRRLKNKPVVMQIPHHGSKYGLDTKMIRLLRPSMAVISVGKNNYGHPSREVLTICSQEDVFVLRTDQKGDVEIVSDGEKWAYSTSK
jgi:competence protein ComEC